MQGINYKKIANKYNSYYIRIINIQNENNNNFYNDTPTNCSGHSLDR